MTGSLAKAGIPAASRPRGLRVGVSLLAAASLALLSPAVAGADEVAAPAWIRVLSDREGMAPRGEFVNQLILGPTEELWVWTEQGLSCLHRGTFEPLDAGQGAPLMPTDLTVTKAGVMVATAEALYWVEELSLSRAPRFHKTGGVEAVAVSGDRLLVLEPDSELWEYPLDSQGRPTQDSRRLELSVAGIVDVLPVSADKVLVQTSTLDLLLLSRTGDSWGREKAVLNESETLLSYLPSQDGTWLLTSERLLREKNGDFRQVTDKLPVGVSVLGPGRDGSVWIVNNRSLYQVHLEEAGGLARAGSASPPTRDHAPIERHRLPVEGSPSAVVEQANGTLWVGTSAGLYFADALSSERIGLEPAEGGDATGMRPVVAPERSRDAITRATFDADGSLWLSIETGADGDGSEEAEASPVGSKIVNYGPAAAETDACSALELAGQDIVRSLYIGDELSLVELREGGLFWLDRDGADRCEATLGAPLPEWDEFCPVEVEEERMPWDLEAGAGGPGDGVRVLAEVEGSLLLQLAPSCLALASPEWGIHPLPWAPRMPAIQKVRADRGRLIGWSEASNQAFEIDLDTLEVRPLEDQPPSATPERFSGWANLRWSLLETLQRFPDSRSLVLGLLPDRQGGVLVGCWRCGSTDLFYAPPSGTALVPIELDVDEADKIGCGNNALLHDSTGTLWLSTEQGLLRRRPNDERLAYLENSRAERIGVHTNALQEYPKETGRVWAAGPEGIWLLEPQRKPRQLLQLEDGRVGVALARLGEEVWAGGTGFLTTFDLNSGQITRHDNWSAIQAKLPGAGFVQSLLGIGEAMIVATDKGILKMFGPEDVEVIELEGGWPAETARNGVRLARLSDERPAGERIALSLRGESASSLYFLPTDEGGGRRVVEVDFPIFSLAAFGSGLLAGSNTGQIYALSDSGAFESRGWVGDMTRFDGFLWSVGLEGIERRRGIQSEAEQVIGLHPRLPKKGQLRLAVDAGGAWLAEPRWGLWRYTGSVEGSQNGADGKWVAWRHSRVRAGGQVLAVSSINRAKAVVLTSAGPARAILAEGGWKFDQPDPSGVLGRFVHAGCAIEPEHSASRVAAAIGTDRGLTIVSWLEGATAPRDFRWSHLDQADGLVGSSVRACAWSAARSELWVGTHRVATSGGEAQGLSRFELKQNTDEQKRDSVHWQGYRFDVSETELESEVLAWPIDQIRFPEDGADTWLRAANRVARVNLDKKETVATPPYLFADLKVELGPITRDGTPRLLVGVSDKPSDDWWDDDWPDDEEETSHGERFSLWHMHGFTRPRLSVRRWLFGVRTRLDIESLDPEVETLAKWQRHSAMDRQPVDADPARGWIWEPDFFDLRPREHTIYAVTRYRPAGGGGEEVRSFRLAEAVDPGTDIWLGRLLVLALVAGIGWRIKRRVDRGRAIRARNIPYIAGDAVSGDAFFGRTELLNKLVSTVARNSFALVGDFRIGKTSIQKQLALTLQNLEGGRHRFLPVLIDLQYFKGDWDRGFFRFLGARLYEAASRADFDPAVLGRLECGQGGEPADYDAQSLAEDVELLIEQPGDRELVLLLQIDEAGLMQKLSYDVLLQFRAVALSSPNLQVIFSGPALPEDRIGGQLSPWSNFLKEVIEVRPLTFTEARDLVVEPSKKADLFEYEEAAVELLYALSQGKPMDLQRLCANLFVFKFQENRIGKVTVADVEDSREWERRRARSERQSEERGEE